MAAISKLIEVEHPNTIISVDTNILMKEPSFSNWKTSIDEPLFVFAYMNIIELQHLRSKKDSETRGAAIEASRSLNNLFSKGKISDGIHIENIGWFISIPSPKESIIKPELDQWNSIVEAFGAVDTKFLLLARELNQSFPDIPSILATGDINLLNIASSNGIPTYQFKGFPMSDLSEIAKKYLLTSVEIDWTSVLEDIQEEVIAESLEVELTLEVIKSPPRWILEVSGNPIQTDTSPNRLLFAEGTGVIYDKTANQNRRFSWDLSYDKFETHFDYFGSDGKNLPIEIPEEWGEPEYDGDDERNEVHLHVYWGKGNLEISEEVFRILSEKIYSCTNPLAFFENNLPTLQSPKAVVEYLVWLQIFEAAFLGSPADRQGAVYHGWEHIDSFRDFMDLGVNWLVNTDSFASQDIDPEENMTQVLKAIENCWSIGETVTFKIIPSSNEEE